MRRAAAIVLGLVLALTGGGAYASSFSNWSALIVAGDWHAHDGGPSEAFDNARRDVAAALGRAGFPSQALRQLSVRPERYKDTQPGKTGIAEIYASLAEVAPKGPGGCLFYLSSHGAPQGALVDQSILPPGVLGDMLDRACGKRPTVVVISACFSGVYVAPLARANRMVLTAARPDRTSFGCGQDNKYPFFDDCFLSSMTQARDFLGLGPAVQDCVRRREVVEKMNPPSEPQVWIGGELKPLLPLMAFDRPPSLQAN